MATRRTTRLDRWVLGPHVVMTIGQLCKTCQVYIPPGATAYNCADGYARCAEHQHDGAELST
jgi:hypothetical protein